MLTHSLSGDKILIIKWFMLILKVGFCEEEENKAFLVSLQSAKLPGCDDAQRVAWQRIRKASLYSETIRRESQTTYRLYVCLLRNLCDAILRTILQ